MVSRRGVLGHGLTALTASGLTVLFVAGDGDDEADTDTDEQQQPDPEPEPDPWQPQTAAKQAHEIVNEERASAGRGELAWRDDVAAAAREYATKLAAAEKLTHTLDGSEPRQRYSTRFNGENINAMTPSANNIYNPTALAESTVAQWVNSDGHRENIMRFTSAAEGIGFAKSSTDNAYAVQVFLR
jgi:uncharacterized protein YkwD